MNTSTSSTSGAQKTFVAWDEAKDLDIILLGTNRIKIVDLSGDTVYEGSPAQLEGIIRE